MKYLIAMLFYNIVLGNIVLYKAKYKEYNEFKGYTRDLEENFKHYKYKVVGVYIMRKGMFKPANMFRMGLVLENSNGFKDYCGINAVKAIDNF